MFNRRIVSYKNIILAVMLFFSLLLSPVVFSQEPFIGEIKMFAGVFCPKGWLEADGRELPISENTTLYSLLGTNFGGNGHTHFKIPDLRGRAAIGFGQEPGHPNYYMGQMGGAEHIILDVNQLPVHSHGISAGTEAGSNTGSVTMSSEEKGERLDKVVLTSGSSEPHENRPPFLVVRYCIANDGIYPTRP